MLAREYLGNLVDGLTETVPFSELDRVVHEHLKEDGWGVLKPEIAVMKVGIPNICESISVALHGYTILNGENEIDLNRFLGEHVMGYFKNIPHFLWNVSTFNQHLIIVLRDVGVDTDRFMPVFNFDKETGRISFDDMVILKAGDKE